MFLFGEVVRLGSTLKSMSLPLFIVGGSIALLGAIFLVLGGSYVVGAVVAAAACAIFGGALVEHRNKRVG